MKSKPLQYLVEIEVPDLTKSPIRKHLEMSRYLLKPSVKDERISDSLLLFGPPGSGKTMLSISLGLWASELLPERKAILVNCNIAGVTSNVSNTSASEYVDELLGAFTQTSEGKGENGLILVISDLEILHKGTPGSVLAILNRRINEIFSHGAYPTLAIGIARDPYKIDPIHLNWFGKKLYVGPSVISEVREWLELAGFDQSGATEFASEIESICAKTNTEYIAPSRLLEAFSRGIRHDLGKSANLYRELARHIGLSDTNVFIDSQMMDEYEQRNHFFIKQSALLESVARI